MMPSHRMTRRRPGALGAVGLAVILVLSAALATGAPTALHGQNPSLPTPVPIGDEAFAVLAGFLDYDPAAPLDPRTLERKDSAGWYQERIVFTGAGGYRVPGILAAPKGRSGDAPLVLLVDGLGGWKERWWDPASWGSGGLLTRALLDAGFAVLMLDAPFHGERSFEGGFEPAWPMRERPARMREMVSRAVIDYRRAIDYAGSREGIDTSRVGVLGLSMGGVVAHLLTAVDPRLDAAVSGLAPLHWAHPALHIDRLPARVRKPMLLLAGRTDSYYTPEAMKRHAERLGTDDKELVIYEAGHRLPPEYVGRAVQWFERYLK